MSIYRISLRDITLLPENMWLSPEGTIHRLSEGISHEKWAEDYITTQEIPLSTDRDTESNLYRRTLLEQGWVRLASHGFAAELWKSSLPIYSEFIRNQYVSQWQTLGYTPSAWSKNTILLDVWRQPHRSTPLETTVADIIYQG